MEGCNKVKAPWKLEEFILKMNRKSGKILTENVTDADTSVNMNQPTIQPVAIAIVYMTVPLSQS